MHCCGAARSRIPICLLRNHPSGDPRLLCCSRLMVVPSLMIEGSSSSSSCLVAQNTPVCVRNCVVLHPKHSHRWPRRSRRHPRLPSFCRQWGGLTLLKAEGGKPTTSERRRPDEGLLRGFTSDRSLGPRGSGGNARPRILSALSAGTLESFRMLSLNVSTKKHSNVSKELWQPQCQGHC